MHKSFSLQVILRSLQISRLGVVCAVGLWVVSASALRAGNSFEKLQAGGADWIKLLDSADQYAWQQQGFTDARREQAHQKVFEDGAAFFFNYPEDPRRWRAAILALEAQPQFQTGFASNGSDPGNLPVNPAAIAEWTKRSEAMVKVIMADPKASPEIKEAAEFSLLHRRFIETRKTAFLNPPADWPAIRAAVETHLDKYATYPALAGALVERLKIYLLYSDCPGEEGFTLGEIRHFASSSIEPVRQEAKRQLEAIQGAGKPLELKFTALDGREVDVATMRGKVVVIDFWAMWCGPCMEALPHIKALYEKYHAAGLEILGVSLDSSKDRQRLTDFCKENGIVWPQYYDGKFWRSDIAVRFDVRSIPRMMLIDKKGQLVEPDLRSENLEAAIIRHLAQ